MFARLIGRAVPVVRATRLPLTIARVAPTVCTRPLAAVQPVVSGMLLFNPFVLDNARAIESDS